MSAQRKRILVVEDDDVLRVMTERQLVHLGYEAISCKDGAAALKAVTDNKCDLILMDVQMPVMDGLESTRVLRERETAQGLPRAPIVAMTANPDREICFQSGMDDFLFKPITIEELFEMIVKWIGPA
jgi:two-component system sensor histidine kinase/response regulator